MTETAEPRAGIYVHIPYCHSKCAYCDFYSTPARTGIDLFVDAIRRELDSRQHETAGHRIATIYLGGGTPSSLPESQLRKLLEILPVEEAQEITIEVNPEDVSERLAAFIAESPINRVSMGIQTLDDNQLRFIGRRHSASDAIAAYERLRAAGIGNISLDLIFGLPGQTSESWKRTLSETLDLAPDHLSAYTLMLEEGTRLTAMVKAGKLTETPDSEIERMYDELCLQTAATGFVHYEISNFARAGFESIHNSAYWDFTPYIGLGPGAHSFDGRTRRFNPSSLKKYLETPDSVTIAEEESTADMINDYIMVRLRTARGLSLEELARRFGQKAADLTAAAAGLREADGELMRNGEWLRIPERSFLVSDPIIASLFVDQESLTGRS